MKPSSAKAKGRRLQDHIAGMLRNRFDLPEEDVRGAIMGESGMDIKLSAAARLRFPFAVEAKNQERFSIWAALQQAESNASQEGLAPLVVFKRNHSKTYAAMPLDVLVHLMGRLWDLKQIAEDHSE